MVHWVLALESLTIATLPPMFFFSFLYYTDILSITFVLAMICFALKKHFFASSCMGLFSVAMRQTNIVWVGVMFCHIALTHIASHRQRKVPEALQSKDLLAATFGLIGDLFKRPRAFLRDFKFVIQNLWGFIVIMTSFVAFVITNGSIVVGDKTAHEAKLHLAQVCRNNNEFITLFNNNFIDLFQICYFSVFVAFFGPQNLLMNLLPTIRQIVTKWKWTIPMCIVLVLVVHFNTVVHPYLLADNRHYTFYVWNRFFARHEFAKYLAIPAYVVCLWLLKNRLKKMNASLSHLFVLGLFATIGMQTLIEVRYFLLPYLFLRLFSNDARERKYPLYLGLEFLFYIAVNCVSFYVFFTKEIRWTNFSEVQRIIW